MSSITSANSIYMLAIAKLFPVPQKLQGFAADDIFDTEGVETGEVVMGVDGILSAGFVFSPIKQSISIQADSPSALFFEAWYSAEQTEREKYRASAVIILASVGMVYTCSNGVLTNYAPMSDAKKVLQPRKFGITWEKVVGVPA